ncbi:MAG: hypothetical protein FGM42_10465 [Ilumatobacteraceae bacterium]|nr:hypothetical protein [Ilumatobacteraceae bacterium]
MKPPAPTEIDAVPSAPAVGVNVAEYETPEPEKPDNEPPATDTSPDPKVDDDSDNVKLTVTVPPAATVPEPERVNDDTDGANVSTTS